MTENASRNSMPPFRIQFAGNLFVDLSHEHFSKFVRPNNSPYLALLGNIGNPFIPKTTHFLEYCSQHWDRVFWIAGPHELGHAGQSYSCTTFRDNMNAMESITKGKKIDVLTQHSTLVDGIQIVGASLWTPVSNHRVEEKYKQPELTTIQKFNQSLSSVDIAEWNVEDISYLSSKLSNDQPTVVLTHHLPHPSLFSPLLSIKAHKRIGLETTNVSSLLREPCKLWLSGASGGSAIGIFGTNTVAVVNSMYEFPKHPSADKNPLYNPELYAEINVAPSLPYRVCHLVSSQTFRREDSQPQKINEQLR
jgi:hypothetical protein